MTDALVDTTETTTPASATDTPAVAVTEKPATETVKPAEAAPTEVKPAEAAPKAEPKTIAAGADTETEKKPEEKKPYWPDDWREKLAEHLSVGDKKVYEKELRRLQRITDPAGIYGQYRELEAKFTGGGLIKIPGKGATEEEVAAYHKALGVPEKPEDYLKDIKLDNGVVIGDADKPIVESFTQAAHKNGMPPSAVSAALNWYYKHQEEQAAAMDERDDAHRRESETALKEEWGAAFKRRTNSLGTLFASAPGGTDIKNEGSLYSRLLGGRMADGSVIGNDPDMLRWLDAMRNEINPAATVVEDGNQSGMTIDAEIKAIEGRMRTDRIGYFKDEAAQARYRDLLTARDKIRARA